MADKNKIDKIQQRIEQLKEQLRQEKSKENARQRKIDTRKKILLGAMLMHWVENGEFKEADLLKGLDKFLTRNIDRALFGLPEISDSTQPTKKNNQTAKKTNTDNVPTTTEKSKTQKSSTSNASDKITRRRQSEEDDIAKEFNSYG